VLDVLVAAGAELEARDGIEETPLHNAASMGNDLAVLQLCRLGARTDVHDGFGVTALHDAARTTRKAAVIEALVSRGAAINPLDGGGRRPLHAAVEANNLVAARSLIRLGASLQRLGDPPRTAAEWLQPGAPAALVELLRQA